MRLRHLFSLMLLAPSLVAHAQGDAPHERRTVDAAAVRRSAERGVRGFEQRRLHLMPNVASASGGRGDVFIGRYRYGAGEAHLVIPLPEEPEAIRAARAALLQTLDSAARLLPNDEWVRGRLVWYAIEAGDTARAVRDARDCRIGEIPWWCDALTGMALHVATRFAEAEQVFERALALMPDSTRCRWTDVSVLLDGEARKLVRSLPCDVRHATNARIWWLADPFHSIDGNERRSEHFARHTFVTLHDRWPPSHPLGWGSDMREIILRYAWSVAWSRDRFRERSPAQPGFSMAITGHEPNPAYDFLPGVHAIELPYESVDDWDLTRPQATSHYSHALAGPIHDLPHHIARFLRGDSLLVIAGWDVTSDTLLTRDSTRVALALSRDDGHTLHLAHGSPAGGRGHLRILVPRRDYLASLEAFGPRRAAARARHGLRDLTSPLAVSDVLLLQGAETARTLDDALARLRPDPRLTSDRVVSLYWEIYGTDPSRPPQMTVTVSRTHASFGRRLAERLRLTELPQTVAIHWETDAPVTQRAAGSVTLDLRDRTPGTWRIAVAVTDATGNSAMASRDVVIAR